MITYDEQKLTATVSFPWPTNDTGNGRLIKEMVTAARSALTSAGYVWEGPVRFHEVRRAETGHVFTFQARKAVQP